MTVGYYMMPYLVLEVYEFHMETTTCVTLAT
ncbi:hypothetical protein LINPERPRIM_LOCUS27927 [Linum perenne]